MFGLKSVYFYLIACQITFIKFFKKLYFSSKNYNKSLETESPKQVYYNPNPYLLSIITSYNSQSFKINEIDPNIFWLENKKKDAEQMHNFFWLSLIDRKTDHSKIKKIIYIWILRNSKYKKNIWETSTLSARVISWILNVDIILKNSTFDFRKNFLSCIISQTNHLKKNIKFEKDFSKKIEILTAIILTGLVFKEYKENFDIGIKELESLVKNFFDHDGFPLSRNPSDLVFFFKYLIFCKEVIKDSQKYVPEFLEDIIEKNLTCIHSIKTPNNQLPLFNGAKITKLNQIEKYLEGFKSKNKNSNFGGLFKIKHKNHFLLIDIDKPPQKKFSKSYQSGPLSFEYFFDNQKVITNSGFGVNISKKARLLSRFTSSQSALCLNDTSIVGFEKNNIMNKAYGFLIKRDFKILDLDHINDSNEIKVKASHNAYLKNFGCIHNRAISIDKIKNKVVGQDKLIRKSTNLRIKYDVRFHLYPGITAVQTLGGSNLLIQINKNKALLFSTNEKSLKIEKSIFFGGQKVLDNYCIVISGIMENNEKIINWEIVKKI